MKKLSLVAWSLLLVVGLLPGFVAGQEVAAQKTNVPQRPDIMADADDPSFGRYVDFGLLAAAWTSQDAMILTDCALEMAEAERILGRNLKSIQSADVMKKAVRIATDRQDMDTLDRIAAFSTRTKNNDMLASVASAKRLAGEERSLATAITVNIITMPTEKISLMKAVIGLVDKARVSGDKQLLQSLVLAIPEEKNLNAALEKPEIDALTKYAEESEKVTAEADAEDQEANEALDRLAGEERGKNDAAVGAAIAIGVLGTIAIAIEASKPQPPPPPPVVIYGGGGYGGGGYGGGGGNYYTQDDYNSGVAYAPSPSSGPNNYNSNVKHLYNPNVAAARQAPSPQPRSINGVRRVQMR